MTRPRRQPEGHYERARAGTPDFGSDGDHTPGDGGTRSMRGIDLAEREERQQLGVQRLPYSWRSVVGPTPEVDHGDRETAKAYLFRLEQAIDRGGWSSSEQVGLYRARDKWKTRAEGNDPRYELVGNKSGGVGKFETANIRQGRIVESMRKELERAFKSRGD